MAKLPTEVQTGYAPVMPYLTVADAAAAIAFYKKAFGAKERFRLTMRDKVGHAELDISGCVVMLSEEFPEMGSLGPKSLKGTPVMLALMVANCDAALKKAVAAGVKVLRPATDEFYGDRSAHIEDPFGHRWMLQQHKEDVSPKEMQRRLEAMLAGAAPAPEPKKSKRK